MAERQISDRLTLSVVRLGDATAKITDSSTFQELPPLIRTVAELYISMVEVAGISVANLAFELIDVKPIKPDSKI